MCKKFPEMLSFPPWCRRYTKTGSLSICEASEHGISYSFLPPPFFIDSSMGESRAKIHHGRRAPSSCIISTSPPIFSSPQSPLSAFSQAGPNRTAVGGLREEEEADGLPCTRRLLPNYTLAGRNEGRQQQQRRVCEFPVRPSAEERESCFRKQQPFVRSSCVHSKRKRKHCPPTLARSKCSGAFIACSMKRGRETDSHLFY